MIDCVAKHHHQPQQLNTMHQQQQQQQQQQQAQDHQLQLMASTQNCVVPQQHSSLANYPQQSGTLIEVPGSAQQQQQSTAGNELIGYYFGSISRETAEWILKNHGNQMNGAYLLRSSGPNDDFVLSIMVVTASGTVSGSLPSTTNGQHQQQQQLPASACIMEVLHYKIVETEDSFVALHGQVGDEKFATIDELIDKAQGVATKPRWPIHRHSLESQILPPTYWGLSVDQVRLAILIKAKQWGFPLLSTLMQQQQQKQQSEQQLVGNLSLQQNGSPGGDNLANITTLNNETIRTLIYKSLHEFQPWFHGKISRDEAERRILDESFLKDGRFLVRERDNFSYAMCISHKKTTKHYRIDVLPTGELAIQDGRKFTSLMALVSHYTIMSDGLWCALTEACPRPIQPMQTTNRNNNQPPVPIQESGVSGCLSPNFQASNLRVLGNNNPQFSSNSAMINQNIYSIAPNNTSNMILAPNNNLATLNPPISSKKNDSSQANTINMHDPHLVSMLQVNGATNCQQAANHSSNLICSSHQSGVTAIKAPIKEWLQTINQKWSQLIASKNHQHQSLNSFLFGNQNPLNNHCRHGHQTRHHSQNHHHRRKCKNGHMSCGCVQYQQQQKQQQQLQVRGSNMTLQPIGTPNNQHASGLIGDARTLNRAATTRGNYNCCNNNNSCFVINTDHRATSNEFVPKNIVLQQNLSNGCGDQAAAAAGNLNVNNSLLLSQLPQNSGFTLNSQSFIGSPLFAVKSMDNRNHVNGNRSDKSSNSSECGAANNKTNIKRSANDEKLISPAQSISNNLNSSPYNLNGDIYGSQTSTVMINDAMQTSSSSSSGHTTNRLINSRSQQLNNRPNLPQMHYGTAMGVTNGFSGTNTNGNTNGIIMSNNANNESQQMISIGKQVSAVGAVPAGPILCGQHAGPAYRYTNCQDESSFKQCYHTNKPLIDYRAADDSQLVSTSTQLAGPAAMAKFVQFQDGQCLRTHRDTRSIQMAYLSCRQQNNQAKVVAAHNQGLMREQQLPLNRNLNQPTCTPMNFDMNNSKSDHVLMREAPVLLQQQQQQPARKLDTTSYLHSAESRWNSASQPAHTEMDLMDCNEDNLDEEDNFDFKYDPKLIKSSSIETLCGIGEDVNKFNCALTDSCKSNAELVMSLQSCWLTEKQRQSDILSPIQALPGANNGQPSMGEFVDPQNLQAQPPESSNEETGAMLSSVVSESSQEQCERLDHLKKKHDLDELTTNLLAELTASLKAQVDLKNKRSGFGLQKPADNSDSFTAKELQQQQDSTGIKLIGRNQQLTESSNPLELINEFDTLISSNNNNR